jgi:hypothetical protein
MDRGEDPGDVLIRHDEGDGEADLQPLATGELEGQGPALEGTAELG